MATAVDQRSQAHLGAMAYDRLGYSSSPQFTNPWGTAPPAGAAYQYHAPIPSPNPQPQYPRTTQPLTTPYTSAPLPAAYPAQYTTVPQPAYNSTYAPRSSPEQYQQNLTPYGYEQDLQRRGSYPVKPEPRDSYSDALDASRGMVAMSQDLSARNIYAPAPRSSSQESYAFPSSHSGHSSISSASGGYPYQYPSYPGSYTGSVDGSSVTDYGSSSEDAMGSRTLPVPGQLTPGFPPEPASMMTQFNSKNSPSNQKKHKCKICEKRFTRPSSLQTHMYSHTGEKPFACDFEGCGRHFSVVSNLRRHKKCHKAGSESGSVEEED